MPFQDAIRTLTLMSTLGASSSVPLASVPDHSAPLSLPPPILLYPAAAARLGTHSLGVAKLILRYDDDGKADEDNDGTPDEIVETGQALWLSHSLTDMIFTYYACGSANSGSSDIGAIGFNQWGAFVQDYGLMSKSSKFCKRADFDRCFLAIDSMSARREAEIAKLAGAEHVALNERSKALNRVEFMTALVQVAINKYVLTKQIADVSDAVTRLLEVDLLSRARRMHDPDEFRRRVCYREDVTDMLAGPRAASVLRELYVVASAGAVGKSKAGSSVGGVGVGMTKAQGELLNLVEFKALLRALGLIDADLSEPEATLCFAWSRMVVIDDSTPQGHLRESHLNFEGFMEALCRVAVLKALPTDAEITASGCGDAGEFLEELRERDVRSYNEMVRERKVGWSEPPPQPEERCCCHLIALVLHRVEARAGGTNTEYIRRWLSKKMASA